LQLDEVVFRKVLSKQQVKNYRTNYGVYFAGPVPHSSEELELYKHGWQYPKKYFNEGKGKKTARTTCNWPFLFCRRKEPEG